MKILNPLRQWAALGCVAVLLAPPIDARTKKGDRFLKLGQEAEAQKHFEQALDYYDKAVETDPREPAYQIADTSARSRVNQQHLAEARKLQEAQKLNEALLEFQKAYLSDPSSEIALQGIRETTAMIKERDRSPAGTSILTPVERAQQDLEKRINSLEGPPSLRPLSNQIGTLKMNNQPARTLYESVCKLAGINVLFDPQGIDGPGGKNFNLDLTNSTLEEALNYVSLVTHTFWKPISRNAIFVAQESEPKRTEYQDEVVKVFYIQNSSTPAEFTEIFNALRTGAKLPTGLVQVPTQNAIIARGSTDTISLVEKLVHDLDRPKAEVVVDVIVMEVSKEKSTTLGAAIAGLTSGLTVPVVYSPRNSTAVGTSSSTTGTTSSTASTSSAATSSSVSGLTSGTASTSTSSYTTIANLHHISSGDFAVSLPGGLIQALLSDNATRVLYRPQVRATDGGKASLKIGSKIPYVSGSLTSTVSATTTPYATTQFQQVDVGVNVDLTPHVNGVNDISMHIKVEVSNVTQTETIAGVQEPIIGQKINEAEIRMRDGEVSLLGGLSEETNASSITGIPGVANIPLLGYLFGSRYKDRSTDDILIALIPHIVRAPDLSAVGQTGVFAGTERVVRVDRSANRGSASGGVVGGGTSAAPNAGVPITPSTPLTPSAPAPSPGNGPGAQPPLLRPQPNGTAPMNRPMSFMPTIGPDGSPTTPVAPIIVPPTDPPANPPVNPPGSSNPQQ